MLRDYGKKYLKDWGGPHKYNCAEVTLRACNDCYDLGLDEKSLKLVAGFGGGMYLRNACGVVTGGVAALSSIFGSEKPAYVNDQLKEKVREFQKRFAQRFSSIDCAIVKKDDKVKENSCTYTVLEGLDILEEVIGKNID